MPKVPRDLSDERDTRISPDLLSPVLAALAALGSIASIAAVNWVAQDKTPGRSKMRRKTDVALRDLESCCLGLHEIFRRLQRHVPGLSGNVSALTARIKFGASSGRISPDAARLHQQLVNDIASLLVLATQNSFDIMAVLEDGNIAAPETVYFAFAEQQEQLNALLQNRPALKDTVDAGAAIARRLADLVGELKRWRVD